MVKKKKKCEVKGGGGGGWKEERALCNLSPTQMEELCLPPIPKGHGGGEEAGWRNGESAAWRQPPPPRRFFCTPQSRMSHVYLK